MLICFVCFLFSICSLSNSSLSRKFIVNAVWVCHPWDSFTRHGQCRVPVCIIILIWIATRGDTWNLNGKCESLRVWRVFYHLFVCYDRINELLSGQRTDRVFDCYVACYIPPIWHVVYVRSKLILKLKANCCLHRRLLFSIMLPSCCVYIQS